MGNQVPAMRARANISAWRRSDEAERLRMVKEEERKTMDRKFSTVVGEIIAAIPDGECQELREAIDKIVKNATYRAPEFAFQNWNDMSDALSMHLNYPPVTQVDQDIFRICTGKAYGED